MRNAILFIIFLTIVALLCESCNERAGHIACVQTLDLGVLAYVELEASDSLVSEGDTVHVNMKEGVIDDDNTCKCAVNARIIDIR